MNDIFNIQRFVVCFPHAGHGVAKVMKHCTTSYDLKIKNPSNKITCCTKYLNIHGKFQNINGDCKCSDFSIREIDLKASRNPKQLKLEGTYTPIILLKII